MGGIGLGLAAAGYRVVKAYDSWPDATAIYNHNAPGARRQHMRHPVGQGSDDYQEGPPELR